MPSSRCLPAIFVLFLMFLGCENQDSIRVYTVPTHESIQIPIEVPDQSASMPPFANNRPKSSTSTSNQRMLAALVMKEKSIWSFKAMTSPEAYPDDAEERFDELIQSLDFTDEGKPKWQLPEGWSQEPGSGMRFATLKLGDLEFSVISSVAPSPDRTVSLLQNINRWRGQVGLPNIEKKDIDSSVRRIPTRDDLEALVIDIRSPKQDDSPPPSKGPVTGTVPEDWQAQKPGMMQLLSYAVDSGRAKMTVSQAGGPVFANVNRWRGQVGLAPMKDESELDAQEISVDEQSALFVELYGNGSSSMAVAMVPANSPRWFFKLMGETEVVKQQVSAFREYLKTVSIQD